MTCGSIGALPHAITGRASPRIARVLREVELGPRLIRKRFVDLA